MMMEVSKPPEYASTTFSDMSAPYGQTVLSTVQQQRQNGFLHVQTVLRLVEDDRALRVDHPVGDLLAAMRRQAVHDNRLRRRLSQQFIVDLVGRENPRPLTGFLFLAHAGPGIGIDGIGPADRRPR